MPESLTKRALDIIARDAKAAAAAGTGKERLIPDGGQPGMYLAVRTGGTLAFQVRYRAGKGRGAPIKVLKLGNYGAITLEQARAAAQVAQGKIAMGEDPAAERDEMKHTPAAPVVVAPALTMERLADAYFESTGQKLAKSTRYEWNRLCRRELIPYFEERPVADITHDDVNAMHLNYEDIKRTGNQLLTVLTALYKYAGASGLLPKGTSPVGEVSHFKLNEKSHAVTPHEYRRLGLALARAERGIDRAGGSMGLSPVTIAAVRMIALTGWRRSEVLHLEWARVDLRERVALQIPTKSGKQDRVLSLPVVDLLARQPRVKGNKYVFPGAHEGASLTRADSAWRALREDARLIGCVRDGDTVRNVRFHDLRHGFVTEAGNIGHDSWAAYQVVGHEGENLRYSHLDRALYSIADDTARHIARYLDGRRVEHDVPRAERTNPVDYRARDRVVSASELRIKDGRHW